MILLALVAAGAYYAIRGWRVPSVLPTGVAVPALGAVSTVAVLVAWLANPYLALLLVPTAHVWLTCASRRGPLPWPFVLGATTLSVLPFVAALIHLSGSLGSPAPWLLLLMVTGGQIGFGTMFSLCLVAGGLLGVLAVSLRGGTVVPPKPPHPAAPAGEIGTDGGNGSPLAGRVTRALDARPITSSGPPDDLWGGR
jgi:hypothetical protein